MRDELSGADLGERPLHDWASHAADAFRYLALGLREPRDASAGAPRQWKAIEDDSEEPGVYGAEDGDGAPPTTAIRE